MTQNFPDNIIYELDNLDVLRGMNSETLVATDPPFNTKRNRSGTAGHYVDNWKWGDMGILPDQCPKGRSRERAQKWNEVHPKWLEEIKDDNPALFQVIEASRVCHGEDIAAFLSVLSVRLLECHRILKPTGSIYLHCDHTANSYIRMAMDAIFGKNNFRNEIVWSYQRWTGATKHFQGSNHLDNRALLCVPCNRRKSNLITLIQLRKENQKDRNLTQTHTIQIVEARAWARQYLQQQIRETPHQLINLDRH